MEKRKELQCTIKGKKNNELYFSINFVLKNEEDFLEQIADKLEKNGLTMEDVHQLFIGLNKKIEWEEGK